MSSIGQITKSTGLWYNIKNQNGQLVKGRLKGRHRLLGIKDTNPVAVGDFVRYSLESDGFATIVDIMSRKNSIARKSTHKTACLHVIASNIDLAVVMGTLFTPRTSTGFIDRFLTIAESAEIPAMVLFNKIDLYDGEAMEYLHELESIYKAANYQTLAMSALNLKHIEELKSFFSGKTVLLCGLSGVGKSTLLNALIPEAKQKTAQVSSFADKGVHTTSFAEMFETAHFKVIDTPGVKELGILHIENENLDFYFPEFKPFVSKCKFHNCLHRNEPGCAIANAVKKHIIPPSRYKSYISILDGFDNR